MNVADAAQALDYALLVKSDILRRIVDLQDPRVDIRPQASSVLCSTLMMRLQRL